MMIADITFYLFAAVLTLSAMMVISSKNPVHSVLFLILAFFNAAGLFVLLGAEFVAMILVIVYVGAVAVLFLFVVMMLNVDAEEMRRGFARHLPVGILVGVILFAQLAFVVTAAFVAPEVLNLTAQNAIAADVPNTTAIGRVMYTKYAYIFQVCGLILLTAMIGAIVLTLRPRRTDTLRQNLSAQIERTRAEAVDIVAVNVGEGVKL